jgi:predicted Zn-dependent protease
VKQTEQIRKTIVILATIFVLFSLFNKKIITPKKTIYISGINYYSEKDFRVAKLTIEQVFTVNCSILENTNISTTPFVINTDDLQIQSKKLDYFNYSDGDILIHITNSDLYCEEIDIKGVSYGDDIYVENKDLKATTIHELSHSFGLEHCANTCIMNPYTYNKWDINRNRPIFCRKCTSSFPKGLLRKQN